MSADRFGRIAGACVLSFALLSYLSLGQLAQSQTPVTGMTGSGHDLGYLGGQYGEVCVYCHTPHAADTAAQAPLWNRVIGTPPAYQRYSALGTVTLQGIEAPVGSVSLACLSCHDGTQAMDTVINAPGRGFNVGTPNPGFRIGTTPTPPIGGSNPLAALGTDLRDDHPVSIQYCGGGITSDGLTEAGTCIDAGGYRTPQFASINNQAVWWLPAFGQGASATRRRTDIFLYTRTDIDGQGGTIQPTVECGSCHDPHVAPNTPLVEVNFMRTSNAGSVVCLSCHNM
jgi:predicted CXXCH cytochrome family protein